MSGGGDAAVSMPGQADTNGAAKGLFSNPLFNSAPESGASNPYAPAQQFSNPLFQSEPVANAPVQQIAQPSAAAPMGTMTPDQRWQKYLKTGQVGGK